MYILLTARFVPVKCCLHQGLCFVFLNVVYRKACVLLNSAVVYSKGCALFILLFLQQGLCSVKQCCCLQEGLCFLEMFRGRLVLCLIYIKVCAV